MRLGRLLRFDPQLLSARFRERLHTGKSLKPGRTLMFNRYQRGSTQKIAKTWFGVYREDVKTADGKIERRQRRVRLGTVTELPTKNAAREKLAEFLKNSSPRVEMTLSALCERWRTAEGPTLKSSTLAHYTNAQRAYILPAFGEEIITNINREDVQNFLAEKAVKYSKSTLRSIRVSLSLPLSWGKACGWLKANPCEGVRLPRIAGGKTITRTVRSDEEMAALIGALKEPYATLVLFVRLTGLRRGEAIALKRSDFTGNTLHVTRRIYDGEEDTVKTSRGVRSLKLDPALVSRMLSLPRPPSVELIFCSRTGTPINPGNALRRYLKPAAKKLGIALSGWHDFRHTLNTQMRRDNVDARVRADILGQARVNLAMDVYDHPDANDFERPLAVQAEQLLQVVTKSQAVA